MKTDAVKKIYKQAKISVKDLLVDIDLENKFKSAYISRYLDGLKEAKEIYSPKKEDK